MPPVSATIWLAAEASSRRSEPTASTSAATASGVVVPPARLISVRTKSIRSAGLVILLQTTHGRARLGQGVGKLPCSGHRRRGGPAASRRRPGRAQYAISAAASSLADSCAPRTTTTLGSANRLGATRSQNSPADSPAAAASLRSTSGSTRRAAAVVRCTARSTSSGSSPVISTNGGGELPGCLVAGCRHASMVPGPPRHRSTPGLDPTRAVDHGVLPAQGSACRRRFAGSAP